MEALAGAAVYPAVSSGDGEFDAISKHRELYLESDGPKDTHPIETSQRGFLSFGVGPLSAHDEEGEATVKVCYPGNEMLGIKIDASNDDAFINVLASLTLEEAREVRDALDDTIEIVEATDEA